MRAGWNAAAPPALPPARASDRLRLAIRAPLALAWTLALFALFLALGPLDRLRARSLRQSEPWAPYVIQAWAAGALRLAGLRLTVRGRPMRHPGVYVANHSSWLDIVALQRATHLSFVAKAEVRHWPGIGLIGRAIGTMFVARRPLEAKRQHAELHARLARGDRMGIFPEGTSTDGSRVLPFKSSLFAVFVGPELGDRLWVQPVSIVYRPPDGLPAAFYGWWGEMDLAPHLRDVLMRSAGGRVELTFHDSLRVADLPDRKALAEAARCAVASELAAPRRP